MLALSEPPRPHFGIGGNWLHPDEVIVDNFAGGGGASEGIEWGMRELYEAGLMPTARHVDIAINHDPEAVAMHKANHPATQHLCQNIWQVDPAQLRRDWGGRPLGLAWFSPDCTDHSKAKGGVPVSRGRRDLGWVVVSWIDRWPPRIIMLENVEEYQDWGPLIARDDGSLVRDPARKGVTFRKWVGEIRKRGYRIEWRERRACNAGAPTIRKRLFVIARNDGLPIVWPDATHGDPASEAVATGSLQRWRTAADCIDWDLPCPSIFETSAEIKARYGIRANRPLKPNTMARIAKGVMRYVVNHPNPFIVPITHGGDARVHPIDDPLRTITTANRGEHALVTPFVTKFRTGATGQVMGDPLCTVTANSFIKRPGGAAPIGIVAPYLVPSYGEREGQEPRALTVEGPMPTVVPGGNGGRLACVYMDRQFTRSVGQTADEPAATDTGIGKTNLVAAFLAQHNTDMVGHDAREPVSTVTSKGCNQAVVSAGLVNLKGSDRRMGAIDGQVPTLCARGNHVGEVRAFIAKYYGAAEHGQDCRDPLHTDTSKPRFGLVMIHGEPFQIVDIGMRMLTPRERFRAQGFRESYIIDPEVNGKPLSGEAQGRMCGNSVSPVEPRAFVLANLGQAPAAAVQAAE
jgi:DNA (cytosine-5)-methyltransferase 1